MIGTFPGKGEVLAMYLGARRGWALTHSSHPTPRIGVSQELRSTRNNYLVFFLRFFIVTTLIVTCISSLKQSKTVIINKNLMTVTVL